MYLVELIKFSPKNVLKLTNGAWSIGLDNLKNQILFDKASINEKKWNKFFNLLSHGLAVYCILYPLQAFEFSDIFLVKTIKLDLSQTWQLFDVFQIRFNLNHLQ